MLKIVLLLSPIYITLFWAATLLINPKQGNAPKVFLGKFMAVASVVYISHFFFFTEQYNTYALLDSFYTLAYLLVYPLYHIYVRLLTCDLRFSLRKHGAYLAIPAIIFVLVAIGHILMSPQESKLFVSYIMSGEKDPNIGIHTYMYWVSQAGRAVFVLQVIIYLYLNFNLIKKNIDRLTDYYSNTEQRGLTWVQFFNFALALTSLSSIMLAVLGRNFFADNHLYLFFPSLVFSILLFTIGYLGYSQMSIHNITTDSKETADTATDSFPNELKGRLDKLFEEEKIYRNPDLKIWDVTTMIGSNRTYVSRLINSEYGRNFCNHVNHYRVEQAKELAVNKPTLTNEQISEISGFGSVNSLYRAFLASEKVSFGEFRKRHK